MDWSKNKNKKKIEQYRCISYITCGIIFLCIGFYIQSTMNIKIAIPLIVIINVIGFGFSLFCITKFFKWKIEKDRKKRVNRFR